VSLTSLEFAQWRAQRRGLTLRTADLTRHSFEEGSFDLVTAINLLEHVPDPIAALEEIARTIRPGGFLCFDLIAGPFDPDEPYHLMRSKYPTRSRIRGLRDPPFQLPSSLHQQEALSRNQLRVRMKSHLRDLLSES
jgi:SAM-dependent methyltransferase